MEVINKYLGQGTTPLISWSKIGFIVYVPPTRTAQHNLLLTFLENVDGKTWRLAKPQPIDIKCDNKYLPEISLVSWSTLSTDLAVSDVYGNFYILLAGVGLLESKDPSPSYELTSYNHMEMIYRDVINQDMSSPVNPEASIVAFKWLNIEKPQILNKPAALVAPQDHQLASSSSSAAAAAAGSSVTTNNSTSSSMYAYGVNQYAPHGLSHPIATKQACVALRRSGAFMLYYQGEHKVEYHKTMVNLNGLQPLQLQLQLQLLPLMLHAHIPMMIDKAAIGFTNDKEIIISAWDSLTNTIFTYLVTIDWGFLTESAKRQKTDPHFHTPKESQKPPTMHLKLIHQMTPEQGLTSIDIISANPEKSSQASILWTYGTTVYRYQITDTANLIHEAFVELGRRQGVTGELRSVKTIDLVDKITRLDPIQSIASGPSDMYAVIYYRNGKIEILDSVEWEPVGSKEYPPTTISTMFDLGYGFPSVEKEEQDHTTKNQHQNQHQNQNQNQNQLMMAVSPNLTSIVYTKIYGADENSHLMLKTAGKVRNVGVSPKELLITSAGFAYRHAYACYSNTCSDDLVLLIEAEIDRVRQTLSKQMPDKQKNVNLIVKKFIETIISESHRSINFQLDAFSKESVDKLLSNPPLQKLLSLQHILGEAQGNTVMSDIAWLILNLRSTNFGIMFTLSSIYRQISKKKPSEDTMQDSITRGECILSLIGNIKWLIDLMAYFNQELMQLTYFKNDSRSELDLSNSIVLPVILSKVPRLFLMYAISSMGKTHEILKKLHKDLAESNKLFKPMKESLNRYFTIFNNAPLTLNLFENYLRECDALVTKEMATKGSLKIEQSLVFGIIPSEVQDLAKTLVERYSISIARESKVPDLFFYNTEWLNLGNESKNKNINNQLGNNIVYNNGVDALRKVNIFDKVRRCTRCRSVSLVTDPLVFEAPSTIGLWTMVFQRTCICGNAWVNEV